jgi:hypothetical protein
LDHWTLHWFRTVAIRQNETFPLGFALGPIERFELYNNCFEALYPLQEGLWLQWSSSRSLLYDEGAAVKTFRDGDHVSRFRSCFEIPIMFPDSDHVSRCRSCLQKPIITFEDRRVVTFGFTHGDRISRCGSILQISIMFTDTCRCSGCRSSLLYDWRSGSIWCGTKPKVTPNWKDDRNDPTIKIASIRSEKVHATLLAFNLVSLLARFRTIGCDRFYRYWSCLQIPIMFTDTDHV